LIVVIDVGKSLTKASLWSVAGKLLARRVRPNAQLSASGYRALDTAGIEGFLVEALSGFAGFGQVTALVPVAHGAGVALLRDGGLLLPPMDYEDGVPAAIRSVYDREREGFSRTGSPALPDGLNLGAQLARLQVIEPNALTAGTTLVPWAQYWSWRFSGVAATEVSSLGCHTDLWYPAEDAYSKLARNRGWAALFAPRRHAADCLGPLTPEWVARTGLSAGTKVHCGLHDTNAALLATRGFPQIAGESTVMSTGTWFVAMRTPATGSEPVSLPEGRDALMNVDPDGRLVPSARFMGGREIELLLNQSGRLDSEGPQIVAAVEGVLARGARILPTFVPGCGPFPLSRGRWERMPTEDVSRRAAVALYAALVADTSLDLIGSRGPILVEGRFAEATCFVRALASLRSPKPVYIAPPDYDASFGALRLIDPSLAPMGTVSLVEPLAADLRNTKQAWREAAAGLGPVS
jgi:sugar (pentulose or hexulose) kinase